MPVVKIFAFLELEQKYLFFKGLQIIIKIEMFILLNIHFYKLQHFF